MTIEVILTNVMSCLKPNAKDLAVFLLKMFYASQTFSCFTITSSCQFNIYRVVINVSCIVVDCDL